MNAPLAHLDSMHCPAVAQHTQTIIAFFQGGKA
jgi:hypothetical protein